MIYNNICLFEDNDYAHFFPLTLNRPIYDLLIGIGTLYEKIHQAFDRATVTLHARQNLKSLLRHHHPGISINHMTQGAPCLFINGRVVMSADFFNSLTNLDTSHNWLLTHQGIVLAAYLNQKNLVIMSELLSKTPSNQEIIAELRQTCMTKEIETIQVMTNLWDFITEHPTIMDLDFTKKIQGVLKGTLDSYVSIYNESKIFMDKGSSVEAFCVLDARKGPIYIGKNVVIEPHTRLEGPLYIGEDSRILGGRVSASAIGPSCKIHGEISHSIVLGYSNKSHDGFVGHSYLGEWVNCGALTTTSNLKNTYGNVMLDFGEKKVKTDQIFIGAFLGDFTKTAIGTTLNTGTIVGFGATLLGQSVHNKYIPAFAWGERGCYQKCHLDKFMEIAARQMERRGKILSDAEKEIISSLYS